MTAELKVLVAEDIGSVRSLVKAVLRELGSLDVAEATSGDGALARLREEYFDLLICDWHMPGMDGLALLQAIRADAGLAALPVILLTGEREAGALAAAQRLGIHGYVPKPFRPATLAASVRAVIRPKDTQP